MQAWLCHRTGAFYLIGDVIGLWRVEDSVETKASLRRQFVLLPEDSIKLTMDFIMVCLVLITVIETPIVVGFALPDTVGGTIFDSVSDCIFFLDMVCCA